MAPLPDDPAPIADVVLAGPPTGAARDPDAPPDPPRPRRSRWRWLRRMVIGLLVLGVVAAVGAVVAFEPVARWYVIDQAARRGVRLTPRVMTVEWGRATFHDVGIELEGVTDLTLHADWLEVRADGLAPRDASARGVDARARSADAVAQVLAFGRAHQEDLIPTGAVDVSVTLLGAAPDGPPVLAAKVAEGEIVVGAPARARAVTLDVSRPRLVVGPVDLVLWAEGDRLEVALGDDPKASPLRVSADLAARRLAVTLAATPAGTLATWLGRPSSAGPPPWPPGLAVAGRGDVQWGADPASDLTGRIDATLLGLVPPHPPELSGIVFGKDTRVSLDLRARPSDAAIALPRLEVAAGSLRLAGTGSIVPRAGSFTASAQLRGSIPCGDLVGSAAVAHLGLALGSGLGSLAQHGLAGSVDVRLGLQVDGERLMQPDVRPSATLHCRLRLLGN